MIHGFLTNEQAQELLQSLVRHCLVGVACVCPKTGTFLSANPAFCDITEFSEVELKARTWMQITHPDDLKADVELARDVVAGDRPEYEMKKRYLTKFGRVRKICLRVVPVYVAGELFCLLAQISKVVEFQEIQAATKLPEGKPPKGGFIAAIQKQWWGIFVLFITSVAAIVAAIFKTQM